MGDVVELMPEHAREAAPDFKRGDHTEIAERLIRDLRAEAPCIFTDGAFYRYDASRGVFAEISPARLSVRVQGYAGKTAPYAGKPEATRKLRINAADVAGVLKLAADRAAEPDFFADAIPGVAFRDRFVRVSDRAIKARPHSPDHRARLAYDFDYVPSARPKLLLRFFEDVFRDDDDREQKIALVQEFCGVVLIGRAPQFQKVIATLGDGDNGKSTLLEIIEGSMPARSVCAIPPQDLGQEYRRAMLIGKLLNVVNELPERDILDSESFKDVVTGELITGRRVRENPVAFHPTAGHVFSVNRLPGTADHTRAFHRRWEVVTFNRKLAESEKRIGVAKEILKDGAANVSWFLQGARRALKQGSFTIPPSSDRAKAEWWSAADQVRAFVEDVCERLPPAAPRIEGLPAEEAYQAYRDWALMNGHKPMASNKFGERMRLLGLPSSSDGKVRRYPIKLTDMMSIYADLRALNRSDHRYGA